MPIKIPDRLPARAALEAEGLVVMGEAEAARQDIRPLRIALLNLMPNKPATELQIARLIGASPLQVELSLVRITDHVPRNTSADHMAAFYHPWESLTEERYDGLIVTGAPVERIDYERVTYWDELRRIFDWTQDHVHHSLYLCWSAMAALHHFHGAPKHPLHPKASGLFAHRVAAPGSPWLRGFSDEVHVPVSRWSEVRAGDLTGKNGLRILLDSEEVGPALVEDAQCRALHMFNHLEYDTGSLGDEYARDLAAGLSPTLPSHYFPGDDPAAAPINRWRSHAHLLFGNWIDRIYQTAPFQITQIGRRR